MTDCELHWLAGLLEGEAWFGITKTREYAYPRITLEMSDRDVVAHAHSLMEARCNIRERVRGTGNALYSFHVSGMSAVKIMRALLPLMGKRRQARIREIVGSYTPKRKLKRDVSD